MGGSGGGGRGLETAAELGGGFVVAAGHGVAEAGAEAEGVGFAADGGGDAGGDGAAVEVVGEGTGGTADERVAARAAAAALGGEFFGGGAADGAGVGEVGVDGGGLGVGEIGGVGGGGEGGGVRGGESGFEALEEFLEADGGNGEVADAGRGAFGAEVVGLQMAVAENGEMDVGFPGLALFAQHKRGKHNTGTRR
jgi:hypothetical protein